MIGHRNHTSLQTSDILIVASQISIILDVENIRYELEIQYEILITSTYYQSLELVGSKVHHPHWNPEKKPNIRYQEKI